MAFGGAAVFKMVADNVVRITGLTLAAAATGTIGLTGNTGSPGVTMPAAFAPGTYDSVDPTTVALQDSIQVDVHNVAATAISSQIVKTGTSAADFLVSITNQGAASGTLEIYVRFH